MLDGFAFLAISAFQQHAASFLILFGNGGKVDAPKVDGAGIHEGHAVGVGLVFGTDAADNADATIELAAKLLLVGATFFVFDGVQSIAVGSLRGMKDTRIPLLFAAISYWLIGFASAYGLAFWTPLGAVGVWIGLSCGTTIYAILVVLRFRLLASRLVPHEDQGSRTRG